MTVPTLPPPVEIDSETKRAVIDGLKRVLAAFQAHKLLDETITYQAMVSDPQLLQLFLATFLTHRDLVDDVVRPAAGEGPVRDGDQVLVCGVSLNQIQQLLVRTCAKKVFENDRAMETVTETVTRKSLFGLIRRTEQVEVTRPANDPVEERKLRELGRYLAYDWQLPLLPYYRRCLSYQQMIEIGDDIMALRTPAAIEAVGRFDPHVLRKVKTSAGPDFADILAHRPQAISGVAVWSKDMYDFYRRLLGEKAWDFFARERTFFNVVAGLDKSVARIFGDLLCHIAAENLEEIERLNIDKIEVLVVSLRGAFGERLPQILAQPLFAKEILRRVVDNMLHMNQEKDKLLTSFALTCKAMVPTVMEWMAKQRNPV